VRRRGVSRPAVALLCVAVLIAGFVAGRIVGSGSARTVTVRETVEHSKVVLARHLNTASDPRDRSGPLDLVRVASEREGAMLDTTIVARRPWTDSLLRRGRVSLSIVYDVNVDGRPDRRDVVFLLRGRLASWISSFGQGVQSADVTRRSATTISIARDATVFYNAAGQAGMLWRSPIGVAVVAHWHGGSDRLPGSGWIIVPPPKTD
jgi:hypothetical protein